MHQRRLAKLVPTIVALTCLLFGAVSLSGTALGASSKAREPLEVYTATVTRAQVARLAREGYDIASTRQVSTRVEVDLVLTAHEVARLRGQGLTINVKKNRDGKTATQLAA